jgi:hypothetical protein
MVLLVSKSAQYWQKRVPLCCDFEGSCRLFKEAILSLGLFTAQALGAMVKDRQQEANFQAALQKLSEKGQSLQKEWHNDPNDDSNNFLSRSSGAYSARFDCGSK